MMHYRQYSRPAFLAAARLVSGRMTSLTVRGTTTATNESLIAQMNRYAARLAGQSNVV